MDKLDRRGHHTHHVEGLNGGRWVLLDFVDFVIHLFHPETRSFYQLERLWDDAPELLISSTRSRSSMLRRAAPALLLLLLGMPGLLSAQYFGRNKVQYTQVRLQDHPDRAFRRVLLRARAGGRDGRRPHGGARLCPAVQGAEPRVPRAEADHPLRLARRLPADQRDRGGRRGHRRRHRLPAQPRGDAVHRLLRGFRARPAARDGPPVPVRHLVARPGRRRRLHPHRHQPRRSGSPRAWRSTSRSGRSTPRPRCGSATPRSRASCPPSSR